MCWLKSSASLEIILRIVVHMNKFKTLQLNIPDVHLETFQVRFVLVNLGIK